jgi:predicted NBD/HSP70 family sugar kinase
MIAGPHITKRYGIDPKDATPEIIDECGRYFAQALVCVAHTLDLEMVTVAGSVALGFGDQFFTSVRKHYDEMVGFPFARGLKIVSAGLGADTPIIGAAAVGLVGIDRDVLA